MWLCILPSTQPNRALHGLTALRAHPGLPSCQCPSACPILRTIYLTDLAFLADQASKRPGRTPQPCAQAVAWFPMGNGTSALTQKKPIKQKASWPLINHRRQICCSCSAGLHLAMLVPSQTGAEELVSGQPSPHPAAPAPGGGHPMLA